MGNMGNNNMGNNNMGNNTGPIATALYADWVPNV